jgi:hypothetical protein
MNVNVSLNLDDSGVSIEIFYLSAISFIPSNICEPGDDTKTEWVLPFLSEYVNDESYLTIVFGRSPNVSERSSAGSPILDPLVY